MLTFYCYYCQRHRSLEFKPSKQISGCRTRCTSCTAAVAAHQEKSQPQQRIKKNLGNIVT